MPDTDGKLRHVPQQARSRERLQRVLDAGDEILSAEGADAFTTTRLAQVAGIPVGSIYHYFPDKQAVVEALALRYWSGFEDLVAAVAESDERDPLGDPAGAVLGALAAGFRAQPGFRALWYGGLRTERIRDVTRPTRSAISRSLQRIFAVHWPASSPRDRRTVAEMVVLAGDGLLREAFRVTPHGDPKLLAEAKVMVEAYVRSRLG